MSPSPVCTEDGRSLEAEGMSDSLPGVREKALLTPQAAGLTLGPLAKVQSGWSRLLAALQEAPLVPGWGRYAVSPGGSPPWEMEGPQLCDLGISPCPSLES